MFKNDKATLGRTRNVACEGIPRRLIAAALGLASFCAFVAGAIAQDPAPAKRLVFQEHQASQLKSNIGKQVVVQGRVETSSKSDSGHHFLNFPSGSVRVICFKDNVGNFPSGGPAALYKGKSIALTGTVTEHRGNLQIQLKSPKQITVAGAASSANAADFELEEVSPGVFVSPAGLRYQGRDPQGKTRIEHVMRHAKNEPNRSGSHGVFAVSKQDEVLALIDEAWALAKRRGIKPSVEGNSVAYTIPLGRTVGYLGGREGTRLRKPALNSVFLVLRRGTTNVITAFPK